MNPSLFDTLFRGKKRWWLLLLAGLLFIACQADNVPRTDDEYLGEQVYWLMHNGKVRSELGYSELGYHIYQSIYHKLFVYTGYLSCTLAGWSLTSLHLVSWLCFLTFLFVLYRYTRYRYGAEAKPWFFALLTLMLLNQDLIYAAGDFRPEIMIMPLGLASYLFLDKFLQQRRYLYLTTAAVCAGLCMFAHLNGVIFIIAGLSLLLIQKQLKAAMIFSLAAVLAFSPYFADVLANADLSYFRQQFLNDPVLASQSSHWYTPLLKILNEQSRFLFTEQHIVFTAMLLTALIAGFNRLREKQGNLLTYTAVLLFALALVNPSKSTKYMVLYLPFLYIILVEGWHCIEAYKSRKWKVTMRTLLLVSAALSLFYSSRRLYHNAANLASGGIVAEGKALAGNIPAPHTSIRLLAPRLLVFNEIGRFGRLQDIGLIAPGNLETLLQVAGIDYIIFAPEDAARFDLNGLLERRKDLLQLQDSTVHYKLVAVKR